MTSEIGENDFRSVLPHTMLSTEDMILALARQFKQLSLEPEKFR